MNAWLRPGQCVVCICAENMWRLAGGVAWPYPVRLPAKGRVYTLREIIPPSPWEGVDGRPFVLLEEIVNAVPFGIKEPSFDSVGFRPVVSGSIEQFRALVVKPPNQKVDA